MKTYLKRSALFILYHPVSHFAGMMAGGMLSLLIGAVFERHWEAMNSIVEPIICTLIPLAILFYIMQMEAYEKRSFKPWSIIATAIPFFILQYIFILIPDSAFWINGDCTSIAQMIFPEVQYPWHEYPLQLLATQLGLQLFAYLPTYLLGSYYGCRRRNRENEKMIFEHEAKTK